MTANTPAGSYGQTKYKNTKTFQLILQQLYTLCNWFQLATIWQGNSYIWCDYKVGPRANFVVLSIPLTLCKELL